MPWNLNAKFGKNIAIFAQTFAFSKQLAEIGDYYFLAILKSNQL
jgi:hypothetical protein